MYVDNITSDAMVLDYNGKAMQIKVYEDLLKEKDKEIERLNKQIEEYQKALDETTSEKEDLENIIKEVREKLNTQLAFTSSYQLNYQSAMSIIEEAKSILDKEVN